MKVRIGKSKIDVSVEGCYRCGVLWSSGWYEYKLWEGRLLEMWHSHNRCFETFCYHLFVSDGKL